MSPRLKEKYETEVLPALQESLGRKNRLSLPRLEKIVVNMGVGSAVQEKKHLEMAVDALTEITGQKPIITRARKSVAGFRLREEMPIGCKVTLRRARMWEFLDRWSRWLCPASATSAGSAGPPSTAAGTTAWGFPNSWCFPS
jgi:large subunit ribosomal protein L5